VHMRVCVCVRMCVVLCVCKCVCVFVCVCDAGAHVCRAPGAVQECRAPGAGAHVCRAAGAGAGAAGAGAGAGVEAGTGPSPLITVHPPTKLYFRQSQATPEPQNKYTLNDTGTTRRAKNVITRDDIGNRKPVFAKQPSAVR